MQIDVHKSSHKSRKWKDLHGSKSVAPLEQRDFVLLRVHHSSAASVKNVGGTPFHKPEKENCLENVIPRTNLTLHCIQIFECVLVCAYATYDAFWTHFHNDTWTTRLDNEP